MKKLLLGFVAGVLGMLLLCGAALWYMDVLKIPEHLAERPNTSTTSYAQPAAPATAEEHPKSVMLDVQNIQQKPELPNGCEATSLAILLNFLGFSADKSTIAYEYLPRQDFSVVGDIRTGPDPAYTYAGDPGSSGGFYCFAPAVVAGAQSYLSTQGAEATVTDLTGAGRDTLEAYLAAGQPIIVWSTMDFGNVRYANYSWRIEATGADYLPYANLHCMVLAGYDEANYYLCNPLVEGNQAVAKTDFLYGYSQLGSAAVAITL